MPRLTQQQIAARVVEDFGQSLASQAGITLRDKPAPLWQLLVLSLLLSARIDANLALSAARELWKAGWRTPTKMASSTWQQRVDALVRGRYSRYDERTSSQLGAAAELIEDRFGGDLRRLHDGRPVSEIGAGLRRFGGIGPGGAGIFLREVQAVWTDLVPVTDDLVLTGAARLGLPTDARRLSRLTDTWDFAALAAGCVRAARERSVAQQVRAG